MAWNIWYTAIVAFSGIDSLETNYGFAPVEPVDTVHVRVNKTRFASLGKRVRALESKTLRDAFAESGQFLKSYGISGSSTISKRGADATQTQVLWNGIPINHPMLGMMDFNGIVGFGMDDIQVIEGGNAALYGSGSVGGTVLMNNQIRYSSGLSLKSKYSYNSLFNSQFGTELSWGGKHVYASLTSYTRNEQNRFHYSDPWSSDKKIAKNVQLEQDGTRMVAGGQWGSHSIKWIGEYTRTERGLGFIGSQLLGSQYDKSIRSVLEHKARLKKGVLVSRLGWVDDEIVYCPNAFVFDTSMGSMVFLQTELYKNWRNGEFTLGLDIQRQMGITRNYNNRALRDLPAVYSAWRGVLGKWSVLLNSRFEFNEKLLTYGWSNEYGLNKNWGVKSDIHKSFRRPTLNDLYWQLSGSNQLKNETGWGAEFGLLYRYQGNKRAIKTELTPFYRTLDNPIIWLPFGGIWKAINLNQGQYIGIQNSIELIQRIGKVRLHLENHLEYVHTDVTNSLNESRQQIFVPDIMSNTTLKMTSRKWRWLLRHNYIGRRFTSTDNATRIDAYHLFDVELMYRGLFKIAKDYCHWNITLEVQNILNTEYQNMPGRPMPGRVVGCRASLSI